MSLIIKLSQNGTSKDFLFGRLGAITIGADPTCDLPLAGEALPLKLLEIKQKGTGITVRTFGESASVFLGGIILPLREEVRYPEGAAITVLNQSFQLSMARVLDDGAEPPPFFETEFKERIERLNSQLRDRETQLRKLTQAEEKKRQLIGDAEALQLKSSVQQLRLEADLEQLKKERAGLVQELKRTSSENSEITDRMEQLRDFVRRLEVEEIELKNNIGAQNLALATLRDERDKTNRAIEDQRALLAALELETLQARESLAGLRTETSEQRRELDTERESIQKVSLTVREDLKEGDRIRKQLTHLLKEKVLLETETLELQRGVDQLESQRCDTASLLKGLRIELDREGVRLKQLLQEIQRHGEEAESLKLITGDARADLSKLEAALSAKRGELGKLDYQHQDLQRKVTSVTHDLERSALKLSDLRSAEKAQEFKLTAIRLSLEASELKAGEERKAQELAFAQQRTQLEEELANLRGLIQDEKKVLSEIETQRDVIAVALEDSRGRERTLAREKLVLISEVEELAQDKARTEAHLSHLNEATMKLQLDRDRVQRELAALNLKLEDCNREIVERRRTGQLELEELRREERAKLQAEKEVMLAEVEVARQTNLAELEAERRRKEDEIHHEKQLALRAVDEVLAQARKTESSVTEEATKRLREATLEAQDLVERTEAQLQEEIALRKQKMKSFFAAREQRGASALKSRTEQHQHRLRRTEEKAHEKLETQKRKELKKIARLRQDELVRLSALRKDAVREALSERESLLRDINEQKRRQETELSEKRRQTLEHINQQKFHAQRSWEEELARERQDFIRTKRDRVANATQAVLNVLIADAGLAVGERGPQLQEKLQATLEMAIDGQRAHALKEVDQILDFNPDLRKRIFPVLKRYALRVGAPAVVATMLLADLGGLRTGAVEGTKSLLRQRQSAAELYVGNQKAEWKEKHTFTPATTADYKESYTDNVIYTTDFEKVLENEEFQNDWILKVHEFMTRELELSEDVAISFISAEESLVKELGTLRKELHPQFLDQGVKKMRDLESKHMSFLSQTVPDVSKLARFKNFRRSTYETFYAEKFAPGRSMASEVKK